MVCRRRQGLVVPCPDPPLRLDGMKMTGKLVSERVCRLETASPGKILADPGQFAARSDFIKKPSKDFRLGSEAS
jgi:hypothetical protein